MPAIRQNTIMVRTNNGKSYHSLTFPGTRPLSNEEELRLIDRIEKCDQALYRPKKPLLERMKTPPSTKPLIDRIDHQSPPSTSTIPKEIRFHKTKKLLRIKEFKEILEPTLDRISPFFTKMSESKDWAENSHYDSLWKWFNRLQDIVLELDKIGHKLTAKEWRLLKGACKRLKSVDFSKPVDRVPEICEALLELNITIP